MGRSDRGDAGRGKVVPYGRSHIYDSDPLPSLPDRGAALLLALRAQSGATTVRNGREGVYESARHSFRVVTVA